MAFCTNCGSKLSEGAKFCSECGATVDFSCKDKQNTRTTIFEGEIHKCPSCGEVLNSFVSNCPSCGYEIRGKQATYSVQQLYRELNKAASIQQKDLMIRNFPIPNAKEDIIEFLVLASSNILGEDDKDIFEAWVAKFEQGYQKALLLFGKETDFAKVQHIYDDFHRNADNEKSAKINKAAADTIIRNIVVCIGVVLMIVSVVIDSSGGNSSLIELVSGIALIASAASLAKRGASMIDFAIGAASGVIIIGLSFLLKNGSMGELLGGIVLIIIAINYFKSLKIKSKEEEK